MPRIEEAILDRIDQLLSMGGYIDLDKQRDAPSDVAREVYAGTLGIVSKVYGPDSPQAIAVNELNSRIMALTWSPKMKNGLLILELRGILANLKAEIKEGLLTSIQQQARGEVLADFVVLAKDAIDNGVKDVAAVLSSAALEDALKRYAETVGIETETKSLSEVLNALKAASALPGPQAKVIQSFIGVRNKAMHADWDKIDTSEVYSLIGFLQDFVAKRFSD